MAVLKAALFDWDGTLFDSFENTNFYNVINKLGWVSEKNIDGSLESPEYFGKSAEYIVSDLFPGCTRHDIELFHKIWDEMDHENIGLLPGTVEILESLKFNGVTTGIISQRKESSLRKLVNKHELHEIFDYNLIQGGDTSEYPKPDPRAFNRILNVLKEYGIQRSLHKVIYVGDSLDDIYCASRAGIEFFGLETGPIKKERWISEGLDEDHICKNLKELSDWLIQKRYLNS